MSKHYKVLFLAMSCNDPFFEMSRKTTHDTWAKDIIEGRYPDVGFCSYTTAANYKERIEDHCVYVNTEDDYRHTYSKTVRTMQLLRERGITWDILIRTNTSTFFNVEKTLELLQTLDTDKINTFFLCNIDIANKSIPIFAGWLMIFPWTFTELLINNFHILNEDYILIQELKKDPSFYANDDVLLGIFQWILYNNDLKVEINWLPHSLVKHYKTTLLNPHLQTHPLPEVLTRADQYMSDPNEIVNIPWTQVRLFAVEHQHRYIELEHMYELYEALKKRSN